MHLLKKSTLIYLLVFLSFTFLHTQDISWTQKSNYPGSARAWSASFSIGNKGYVGTGGHDGGYTNDFWEFDPETNVWTQKANVGGGFRGGAVGFSIGDKGYIGLGRRNTVILSDFWEYNPLNNHWSIKANYPGQGKVGAVSFSIDNKGYVGTGSPSSTIGNETNDFWEYNPSTDSWLQKSDFGGNVRDRAVGFSIGTKGYIGTGYHYDGTNPIQYNDFWEYNSSTDSWSEKAELPADARSSAAGFSIGNKGYLGTGYWVRTDFWKYDPENNDWAQMPDFVAEGRIAHTSLSINNKGYIGMGYYVTPQGPIYLNDFWEFEDGTLSDGSDDLITSKEFKVFPNPSTDVISVSSECQSLDITEFVIYDIQGKEQLKTNRRSINVNALTSGTYFIKINTSNGVFTKQFIKK